MKLKNNKNKSANNFFSGPSGPFFTVPSLENTWSIKVFELKSQTGSQQAKHSPQICFVWPRQCFLNFLLVPNT